MVYALNVFDLIVDREKDYAEYSLKAGKIMGPSRVGARASIGRRTISPSPFQERLSPVPDKGRANSARSRADRLGRTDAQGSGQGDTP